MAQSRLEALPAALSEALGKEIELPKSALKELDFWLNHYHRGLIVNNWPDTIRNTLIAKGVGFSAAFEIAEARQNPAIEALYKPRQ